MSHTSVRGPKLGAETWLLPPGLIASNPKSHSWVQLATDVCVAPEDRLTSRASHPQGALPGGDDTLEFMGFCHSRVIYSVGELVRGHVSTHGVEDFWSLLKCTYTDRFHYLRDEHPHPCIDNAPGSTTAGTFATCAPWQTPRHRRASAASPTVCRPVPRKPGVRSAPSAALLT